MRNEHSYAPRLPLAASRYSSTGLRTKTEIEIASVYVDEIIIARLKLTKDLLCQIGTLPATMIAGDEQDLITCCDKLIAYYSPIRESRLRKKF